MIQLLLIIFGLSNAQEPTNILELKNTAIEMAVSGNTKLLDCIDKNNKKGGAWTLQVCKVGK